MSIRERPVMFLRAITVCVLFLSACGGPPKIAGTDALDQNYVLGGGEFDDGGEIVVAAAARDFGGRIAVCAVFIEEPLNTTQGRFVPDILDSGRIQINGETVLSGLKNLPSIRRRGNVAGAPTACYLTGKTWTDGPVDLQVIIPTFSIRTDRQEATSFRQAPVSLTIGPPPSVAPQAEPAKRPGQWDRSS